MDSSPSAVIRTVLVVFEGCDVMDVTGPYEVLLTVNRMVERDGGNPPFDVVIASEGGQPVTAYGGLGLIPTADLGALDDADLVIVPGLIDLQAGLAQTGLLDAIRDTATQANPPLMTSVCTGSFLLDAAGWLGDRAATTHHEDVGDLRAQRGGGAGDTVAGQRWVDAGDVVTAAGLSSGIAMALHLVERFVDRDAAQRTADQIEYVWTATQG